MTTTTNKNISFLKQRPIYIGVLSVVAVIVLGSVLAFSTGFTTPLFANAEDLGTGDLGPVDFTGGDSLGGDLGVGIGDTGFTDPGLGNLDTGAITDPGTSIGDTGFTDTGLGDLGSVPTDPSDTGTSIGDTGFTDPGLGDASTGNGDTDLGQAPDTSTTESPTDTDTNVSSCCTDTTAPTDLGNAPDTSTTESPTDTDTSLSPCCSDTTAPTDLGNAPDTSTTESPTDTDTSLSPCCDTETPPEDTTPPEVIPPVIIPPVVVPPPVVTPPCTVDCNVTPPPPGCTVNCTPPPPCTSNCTPPPPCTVNCTPPPPCTINCTPPPPCTVNCTPPPPCTINCSTPPPGCTYNCSTGGGSSGGIIYGGGGGGSSGSIIPVAAPASYVYLSQIPYTGLDLGPIGTIVYWTLLVLFCLAAAYLIIFSLIPFLYRHIHGFGTNVGTILNQPAGTLAVAGVAGAHGAAHAAPSHGEPAHAVHAPVGHVVHSSTTTTTKTNNPSAYTAAQGFRSFAQGQELTIDDIVNGLSRLPETNEYVAPVAAMAPAQTFQSAQEVIETHSAVSQPAHYSAPARQEAAAAAISTDVRDFCAALLNGDRDTVFGTMRQIVREGGDAETFLTQVVVVLDDAYRARMDGTQVNPEIARLTQNCATPFLERLTSALTNAVDSSYTPGISGSKLALTRALAVVEG